MGGRICCGRGCIGMARGGGATGLGGGNLGGIGPPGPGPYGGRVILPPNFLGRGVSIFVLRYRPQAC
jgi:hypothetical protein